MKKTISSSSLHMEPFKKLYWQILEVQFTVKCFGNDAQFLKGNILSVSAIKDFRIYKQPQMKELRGL